MDPKRLENYQQKRKSIIKEYRAKKIKSIFAVLGIGGAVAAAILLVGGALLKNIPVTAVLTLITVLFTIIYMRIRVVTVNHTMQQKLLLFEEDY